MKKGIEYWRTISTSELLKVLAYLEEAEDKGYYSMDGDSVKDDVMDVLIERSESPTPFAR